MKKIKNLLFLLGLIILPGLLNSCSDNDDVRMPDDIMGIWSPSDNRYLELSEDFTVHNLEILYQDGESIGQWTTDAFLYEPGYHILLYSTGTKVDVYQIIELTSSQMIWCWVEEVHLDEVEGKEGLGKIIGKIIKEAQEGFNINPELYQTFQKISENDFLSIIEKLNIIYPW